MDTDNHTSYEASSFCMDASKLNFNDNGMVEIEDFPAFVHEWWHYIQDISTITGQNGFYLWMRDIARMTSITCAGERKTITLPLSRDEYEEVYSKYRQIYNIFCGEKIEKYIDNPKVTAKPIVKPNGISFDGETHTFAKCEVQLGYEVFYFGLIALQELNAFYAQKIVESYVPDAQFNVQADSLPDFPYKVGDYLFEYYSIECDLKTKFIITYLVLDTLQAPAIFLHLLEELSGKCLDYTKDKAEILKTLNKVANIYSYSNSDAVNEWLKDYSNWFEDQGHKMMRESLIWYISTVASIEKCKSEYGDDCLPISFCSSHEKLKALYGFFPVPLIKQGQEVKGQAIFGNEKLSFAAKHDFENALIIWSHRRIYDLLRSKSREDFIKNSVCPLYNNGACLYLYKYKSDKRYDCCTSPWMVVKGEKQALCPYSVAAHSMGLWQNEIDIQF